VISRASGFAAGGLAVFSAKPPAAILGARIMIRTLPRYLLGLVLVLGLLWPLTAADPVAPETKLDLSEFKTVDKAIATTMKKAAPAVQGQSGYLGVHVATNPQGKLVVADVSLDSPAAKAGLQKEDLLLKVAGKEMKNPDVFREMLLAHRPGEDVKLSIVRQETPREITVKLGATSRPVRNTDRGDRGVRGDVGDAARPVIGLSVGEPKEGEGAPITRLLPDLPAEKAGLKVGEYILKIDGKPVAASGSIRDLIADKKAGDVVMVTVKRDDKHVDVKVTLGGAAGGGTAPDVRGGGDMNEIWKKPIYKLAVICVEYPDVKHNAKIALEDWQEALFSRDRYKNKESVTGQPVYGSLTDYYREMSCGALKIDGKVFDWVEVKKNRMDYAPGSGTGAKGPLLTEALELVQKRDGKDALKDFDGLFFVYAGEPPGRLNRGHLYSPHRSTVRVDSKNWSYFLCPEGGARLTNTSLICHEFGLLLGLPELSARQENAGSKGAGAWCCMSNQSDSNRPQHLCAWSKEQFGWIKPTVLDPTVRQKLILAPIEGNVKECYKVLLKLDGSEYLLLENRQKKGYDESLPGEGLLIWRVVQNKPILAESHGIEGPAGPRSFLNAIPYPSSANDSFTPYTTPSSRAQLGGGLPVYLTNIRRLPDGRITFHIGYEYQ
jgi:M6 family metalloprotease-like protein